MLPRIYRDSLIAATIVNIVLLLATYAWMAYEDNHRSVPELNCSTDSECAALLGGNGGPE